MSKPLLLDTCCKAGGATKGYQRAGWYVVGVDIEPQPRYCGDEFYQADALEFIATHGREFDAIHASPPCQAFTNAQPIQGRTHPDLLTPMRVMLEAAGLPYVIENVPGSPMRPDIVLCGGAFGLEVQRHRWFEVNWPHAPEPTCMHIFAPEGPIGVYGHTGTGSARLGRRKSGNHGYVKADWARAMAIDWMTRDELAQAIPPAYCQWVGHQLMAHLKQTGVGHGPKAADPQGRSR